MPDEHASGFAETLAGLKSGDVEPSDSETSEFADIIDEEEVEVTEAKERFFQNLFVCLLFLWLIIDPESLIEVVASILF